jgi:hypothetical protein
LFCVSLLIVTNEQMQYQFSWPALMAQSIPQLTVTYR